MSYRWCGLRSVRFPTGTTKGRRVGDELNGKSSSRNSACHRAVRLAVVSAKPVEQRAELGGFERVSESGRVSENASSCACGSLTIASLP